MYLHIPGSGASTYFAVHSYNNLHMMRSPEREIAFFLTAFRPPACVGQDQQPHQPELKKEISFEQRKDVF